MKYLLLLLVLSLTGCNNSNDGITFYEAVRARSEECTIRSNGEFCVEPDQFDPPVTEVWAVHVRSDATLLYLDEEVWVMDPQAEDASAFADAHTTTRSSTQTDGSAGCTTTRVGTITFVADGTSLTGTVASRTVLEGPASCGDTPIGERTVDIVTGSGGGP
jgi:hypothetical protein